MKASKVIQVHHMTSRASRYRDNRLEAQIQDLAGNVAGDGDEADGDEGLSTSHL
jgi:hypothetical protein